MVSFISGDVGLAPAFREPEESMSTSPQAIILAMEQQQSRAEVKPTELIMSYKISFDFSYLSFTLQLNCMVVCVMYVVLYLVSILRFLFVQSGEQACLRDGNTMRGKKHILNNKIVHEKIIEDNNRRMLY